MKICTVALDTVWKDPKANIAKTEECVKEAKQLFPEVQVVLFPELSFMGSVVDEDCKTLAQSMDGECVTETARIARENGVLIIAAIIEKGRDSAPFNTTFAVNKQGNLVAVYRKNHLYAGSKEGELYDPGEELAVFEFEGWACGLACCFDVRFPRLFEAYRRAGVEVMFMTFNWFAGRNKPAIMDFMIKARAHENQFFIAATDRTGTDPSGGFSDQGIIVNPYGESVVAAKNGIYSYAELSKEAMETLRKTLPLEKSFKDSYQLKKVTTPMI